MTEATIRRLLLRVAELERQNADLQATNNKLLQRARNAEDRLKAFIDETVNGAKELERAHASR